MGPNFSGPRLIQMLKQAKNHSLLVSEFILIGEIQPHFGCIWAESTSLLLRSWTDPWKCSVPCTCTNEGNPHSAVSWEKIWYKAWKIQPHKSLIPTLYGGYNFKKWHWSFSSVTPFYTCVEQQESLSLLHCIFSDRKILWSGKNSFCNHLLLIHVI